MGLAATLNPVLRRPCLGLGVFFAASLCACAGKQPPSSAPSLPISENDDSAPAYSDQDAQEELGFSTEPTQRIRSRRRSRQRTSMPVHGAKHQPCAFDDCDISDEDDPLSGASSAGERSVH